VIKNIKVEVRKILFGKPPSLPMSLEFPVPSLVLFHYSGAIMKYLSQNRKLPDHWYPGDLQKRAKIDEYLSWHHTNLRMGAAVTVFEMVRSITLL